MMYCRKRLWGLVIALSVVALPAWGQGVHGGLQLGSEAGYLTNAYLDPSAPVWDPAMRTAYGAVRPTAWLAWTGRRSSALLSATGRHVRFKNGTIPWTSGRANLHVGYTFENVITTGIDGGIGIFEGTMRQQTAYVLPSVTWHASSRADLTARAGLAHQAAKTPAGDEWSSTTRLAIVEGTRWIGARSQVGVSLHASQTQIPAEENTYSGLGGALNLTQRLPGGVSVRAEVGLEQYGYHMIGEAPASSRPFMPVPETKEAQSDLLWRATLSGEWPVTRRLTVLARSTGSRFQSSAMGDVFQDMQIGLGLRVSLNGAIYESPAVRPLWTQEGSKVHIRIPYAGASELFLVGDFNDWEQPGVRLTQSGNGIYTTNLQLEPGTYTYRVRIQGDADEKWLTLPEYALTVTDGYGGRNGLLIVEPDTGE